MKRGGVGGSRGEVEEDRGGVEEAEEVALGGTGGVEARVPDDALAAAANVLALRRDSVKGDSSNDIEIINSITHSLYFTPGESSTS